MEYNMAVITPDTDLKFLKVPLEISDTNQINFANATAQYNYFNGLANSKSFDNFTYQRKDGTIRVPETFDNMLQYNYVMYRNTAYSSKWFYAYIEDLQYVNDGVTAVKIRTDVFQTWQFSITYKSTFVEREHVNDDTIGANTVPEGLECGDYLIEVNREIPLTNPTTGGFMVCFMCTSPPYNNAEVTYVTHSIGNVYSGLLTFACTMGNATHVIDLYKKGEASTDAIINIYMIPEELVDTTHYSTWTVDNVSATICQIKTASQSLYSSQFYENTTLNGYTPKNKKLYCYPYKYFHISNNAGSDVEFRWEDCPLVNTMPAAYINVDGIACSGAQAKLTVTKYKGYDSTASGANLLMAYGVSSCKLPTCAWQNDYYTNWLTQNSVNIATGIVTGAGTGAMYGIYSGNAAVAVGGALLGAATQALSSAGEVVKAQKTPDQAKGDTGLGDLNFANQESAFNMYCMTIRAEFARIIDDYFSMFGYKVNRVKVPNITGRTNWNFVKTVDCYIDGPTVPQLDLAEIKNLFNKGITIWHNTSTFMDYSQSNGIVS